jgi:hypothetical protein
VTDDELGCGIGSAVRLHGGGGRRRQGGREGGRERAGPASRSALAALTARSPPLPLPPPPPRSLQPSTGASTFSISCLSLNTPDRSFQKPSFAANESADSTRGPGPTRKREIYFAQIIHLVNLFSIPASFMSLQMET